MAGGQTAGGQFVTDPRSRQLIERPRMHVDGEWLDGAGDIFTKVNPTTGETLAGIPLAGPAQVSRALAAARRAFDDGAWSRTSPVTRSDALYRLAELVEADRAFLTEMVIADLGAPVALATTRQLSGMLGHLRWFAEAARRGPDGWYEKALPLDVPDSGPASSSMLVREPAGVVAAFPAYNYPYTNTIWKLAAALAAGCSTVLQPSTRTALSVTALWTLIEQLDLPPGVVNLVFGEADSGRQLTTSDEVDMVSFTGSAAVGAAVMAQSAPSIKRVVLELGGKSAAIVLPGIDVESVAGLAVNRLMSNTGQACGATSRILVHENDLHRFADAAVKHVDALRVGDPRDPRTQLGPLIDARHRDTVQGYIDRAVTGGARVLAEGAALPAELAGGFFLPPVLLAGVGNDSELCQEEQFGPVGAVLTYRDVDEAVAIANDSKYGLNASVYGPVPEAVRVARQIRSGTVVVNGGGRTATAASWGGVRHSGTGREAGDEGFREFFETKHIQVGFGSQ
jgi:aldehyde dehydrogenase (NAD+)/betaine-aldehyde dehydrogenase